MQARARDSRDARKTHIGPMHKHVMGLVANHLELDEPTVEDFVLDSQLVLWITCIHVQLLTGPSASSMC